MVGIMFLSRWWQIRPVAGRDSQHAGEEGHLAYGAGAEEGRVKFRDSTRGVAVLWMNRTGQMDIMNRTDKHDEKDRST